MKYSLFEQLKELPAFIYCRVSIDDEEEKTCMEIVEKYELDLQKIYVEMGSAMRMHQGPKFMDMLKEVKSLKGKKIIIVYDLSRLSRNLGDTGEIEGLDEELKANHEKGIERKMAELFPTTAKEVQNEI